ncbi:MAG: TlpA family protein disulfide reductase [Deltaproteobacteria bacterium]|nr:TlpA family protein disulfide reductase [Deltaproteobacteria bacterium]
MKKNIFISVFLLATLLLLTSCKKEKEEVSALESNHTQVKDFTLTSLDGNREVGLKDFKGKPIVINFWASWCGPCREEMPFLEKSWNEYKDKGVVLIGIDVLDDEKNARDFLKTFGISYINLKDQSGEVANKYGVVALPATIFIDKKGRIIRKNYGPFLGEDGEKNFISYVEEIAR